MPDVGLHTLDGVRVLVVEDESNVAMLVEEMLADLGAEVTGSAGNVARAMTRAGGTDFDIALLDVNLGGEKVYPVADLLAARGKPFVFTTGYSASGLRADLRARPVVVKPFMEEDLRDAIWGALHH